jgi:hypothetical protein
MTCRNAIVSIVFIENKMSRCVKWRRLRPGRCGCLFQEMKVVRVFVLLCLLLRWSFLYFAVCADDGKLRRARQSDYRDLYFKTSIFAIVDSLVLFLISPPHKTIVWESSRLGKSPGRRHLLSGKKLMMRALIPGSCRAH